jgi:hypothetical protein
MLLVLFVIVQQAAVWDLKVLHFPYVIQVTSLKANSPMAAGLLPLAPGQAFNSISSFGSDTFIEWNTTGSQNNF